MSTNRSLPYAAVAIFPARTSPLPAMHKCPSAIHVPLACTPPPSHHHLKEMSVIDELVISNKRFTGLLKGNYNANNRSAHRCRFSEKSWTRHWKSLYFPFRGIKFQVASLRSFVRYVAMTSELFKSKRRPTSREPTTRFPTVRAS